MSKLQAVLFDKRMNNPRTAYSWLMQNELYPIKPLHTTNRYIRARIEQPLGKMRTININKQKGIKGIVMSKKAGSLHFPTRGQELRKLRRNGMGAIGSDLAVGAATVGVPLLIYAIKKIYDKVSNKGGVVGNLNYKKWSYPLSY